VCDPADYERVVAQMASPSGISARMRRELAAKAFAHTAAYDSAISSVLSGPRASDASDDVPASEHSRYFTPAYELAYELRYGENPHQKGAFYIERSAGTGTIAKSVSLGAGGKELSFNNLVDADAALEAVREFEAPAAVVVKHANPCGVATASSLVEAYVAARDADALSAFGGIVALNREVDETTAERLAETFLECVIAPSFSPAALECLRTKKNLRVLATGALRDATEPALCLKSVSGGLVVQSRDFSAANEVRQGRVMTRRLPTVEELNALEFAWRVCKHVKSNAIVLAKGEQTVGIGAGQMSRVVSVQIACEKAGYNACGSVLASDAFFPFADGVELAAKHGITAIAQPGGSVKDASVIAMAESHGIAMIATGVRHFRHG